MTRFYTSIQDKIKALSGASEWKVGDVVRHPDGYNVKILRGQYLSGGRVSNWWEWVKLDRKGRKTKTYETGYGW
jgi:hypothetical protein